MAAAGHRMVGHSARPLVAPDRIRILTLLAMAASTTSGMARAATLARLQFLGLENGADPEWLAHQIECALAAGESVSPEYVGPTWSPIEQLLISALGRDSRPATVG